MKKMKIFVCLAGFLSGIQVIGQVNLKNTGTLYISTDNDTLYINGAFTNASGSALTNNGWFYIKQNITNDQISMSAGTGTLYLSGTSAQSIDGTQPFYTYNLVTNNSAGITLNNDLSVSGQHTYSAGLIASSSTPNYLIYESGSSYTGDNDSRHVTGWVKKNGNSNFTFPVGNNTYERTVGISNLSAVSEINAHYYRNTQNVYNLFSPLISVDSNEYWQLNKVSGGTLKVVMNWNHPKVPFYNVLLPDITSSYYVLGAWHDVGGSASGTTTTTGTITTNTMSNLGSFGFGYKSTPIPLKLISFTANRNNGMTHLQWITENEDNVSHFELQRSPDGNSFSTFISEPARNNSLREYYNQQDGSAIQKIAYYRIRCVDRDGKAFYSKIIAVSDLDLQSLSLTVENPAHHSINISNKSGKEGLFDYKLIQTNGAVAMKGNIFIHGNGSTVIPLSSAIPAGIYVLELNGLDTRFQHKVLLDK